MTLLRQQVSQQVSRYAGKQPAVASLPEPRLEGSLDHDVTYDVVASTWQYVGVGVLMC